MDNNLETKTDNQPKQTCWRKLKNKIEKISKEHSWLLIISGVILLIFIIGGYIIYEYNTSKKDNEKEKVISSDKQIFNLHCSDSYTYDGYYQCELGYETNSNNGLTEISGTITAAQGLKIISVENRSANDFHIDNYNFKVADIPKDYASVGDELLIIKFEKTDEANSDNIYFEITNLIAKAKDKKTYSYKKLVNNFVDDPNNGVSGTGKIYFSSFEDQGVTQYIVSTTKDNSKNISLIYEYDCTDKSCDYDNRLTNKILVTDNQKVFEYDFINEKITNYDLSGNISSATYLFNYDSDNPKTTGDGFLVTFKDGLSNFYSYASKNYIFKENMTYLEWLDSSYIAGYNKFICGVSSTDGRTIIPFEYDAEYFNPYNYDEPTWTQYYGINYYVANGETYFILSKNMKYGIVDENNNITMDFNYDNLFYSSELKMIYSNIFDHTTIMKEEAGENGYGEITSDKSTFGAKQYLLNKIDFFSLTGKYEKSIEINDSVRYSEYPTILCRNSNCNVPYFLNSPGIDSFSFDTRPLFNDEGDRGAGTVYKIGSDLILTTYNSVYDDGIGIDSYDYNITNYMYIKIVDDKYMVYSLNNKPIMETKFDNIIRPLGSWAIYQEKHVIALCKTGNNACGIIDEKGGILLDFIYTEDEINEYIE